MRILTLALVAISYALAVAVFFGAEGRQILSTETQEPPVEWVHDSFEQGVSLCPGDVVTYTLGIKHTTSGVISFATSVHRQDDHPAVVDARNSDLGRKIAAEHNVYIIGDTVVLGDGLRHIVVKLPDGRRSAVVDIDPRFTAPDLPPGTYVRNLAVWVETLPSRPAIRQQFFAIGEGCVD